MYFEKSKIHTRYVTLHSLLSLNWNFSCSEWFPFLIVGKIIIGYYALMLGIVAWLFITNIIMDMSYGGMRYERNEGKGKQINQRIAFCLIVRSIISIISIGNSMDNEQGLNAQISRVCALNRHSMKRNKYKYNSMINNVMCVMSVNVCLCKWINDSLLKHIFLLVACKWKLVNGKCH